MTLNKISRLLLVAGSVLFIYGLFMDVSVEFRGERIYNLNKASDRNIIFMLGGFLFLGGIMTLVASRLKPEVEKPKKPLLTEGDLDKLEAKLDQTVTRVGDTATKTYAGIAVGEESHRQTTLRLTGTAIAALLAFQTLFLLSANVSFELGVGIWDTWIIVVPVLGIVGLGLILFYLYGCIEFDRQLVRVGYAGLGATTLSAIGFIASFGLGGFVMGLFVLAEVACIAYSLRAIGRKWKTAAPS